MRAGDRLSAIGNAASPMRLHGPLGWILLWSGGDNWPVTWADDDVIYTTWGDGWGFHPRLEKKLSLGSAKVLGPPQDFTGVNIRSEAEQLGDGRADRFVLMRVPKDRVTEREAWQFLERIDESGRPLSSCGMPLRLGSRSGRGKEPCR